MIDLNDLPDCAQELIGGYLETWIDEIERKVVKLEEEVYGLSYYFMKKREQKKNRLLIDIPLRILESNGVFRRRGMTRERAREDLIRLYDLKEVFFRMYEDEDMYSGWYTEFDEDYDETFRRTIPVYLYMRDIYIWLNLLRVDMARYRVDIRVNWGRWNRCRRRERVPLNIFRVHVGRRAREGEVMRREPFL